MSRQLLKVLRAWKKLIRKKCKIWGKVWSRTTWLAIDL